MGHRTVELSPGEAPIQNARDNCPPASDTEVVIWAAVSNPMLPPRQFSCMDRMGVLGFQKEIIDEG